MEKYANVASLCKTQNSPQYIVTKRCIIQFKNFEIGKVSLCHIFIKYYFG